MPIDPSAIESGDVGEKRAIPETDHGAAIELVRETVADAGFGSSAEFSPSEMVEAAFDAF